VGVTPFINLGVDHYLGRAHYCQILPT